ncbi:MAG: hypothetical protein HOW73_23440 [Polyangiaceae bacterium]|nr:hypothetical protein [Polyangiaceae bacterium]
MRALVVGAGAVGRVYGHHLARAGADVAVYVRPAHRKQAEDGYVLSEIRLLGARRTHTFRPSRVVSEPSDLASLGPIDQVWLCLPTTALDEELLERFGDAFPRASIVVMTPGHFVKELVCRAVGARRAVFGVIGMLSYLSPLEGSDDPREQATPSGIAYFLARTKLSSASERRALDAAKALEHGGCPAEVVADATAEVTLSSAVLMPVMATLEVAEWSLSKFAEEQFASLASAAIAEALAVATALTGRSDPFAPIVSNALPLRLGARIAPRFAPFDVEGFLRVHFTKVDEQTRLLLEENVTHAKRLGLPHAALDDLLSELTQRRSRSKA